MGIVLSRSVLFVGWGFVGLAAALAALYVVTPLGLLIAAAAGLVAVALHEVGEPPRTEAIGLVAGAGTLLLLWATNPDPPQAAFGAGLALVGGSVIAFGIVARRSSRQRG